MNALQHQLWLLARRVPQDDTARFYRDVKQCLAKETRVSVLKEVVVHTLPHREGLRDDDIWLWTAYRMAELKTDAAAQALVSLLDDPRFRWDAGDAYGLGIAITRLGKPALPFLLRSRHALAKQLIPDVRQGKVW